MGYEPPNFGPEPPLKQPGTLSAENLAAAALAVAALGLSRSWLVARTVFRLAVGGSVAEVVYGYAATSVVTPISNLLYDVQNQVLSKPITPEEGTPFIDPLGPSRFAVEFFRYNFGGPEDVEAVNRAYHARIASSFRAPLLDTLGALDAVLPLPPSAEVNDTLRQLSARLQEIANAEETPLAYRQLQDVVADVVRLNEEVLAEQAAKTQVIQAIVLNAVQGVNAILFNPSPHLGDP